MQRMASTELVGTNVTLMKREVASTVRRRRLTDGA